MEKILVVEDNISISKGMEYYLKKEGFQVELAQSATEAKKSIMNDIYDLIILDVGLPDGDGFEIAKEIRKISIVPVIFVTARDEQEDIIKGLSIGGDDYITKPFSVRELCLRVNSIINRSRKSVNVTKRRSGNITMDLFSRDVFLNGKAINLTQSEYKLLNVFLNNPRLALSRDDLLRQIWDTNEKIQGPNTITVYIKRLREKIEEDVTDPKYITTIRKGGYMWDADVMVE